MEWVACEEETLLATARSIAAGMLDVPVTDTIGVGLQLPEGEGDLRRQLGLIAQHQLQRLADRLTKDVWAANRLGPVSPREGAELHARKGQLLELIARCRALAV